jgi:hypothetical protein
MRFITVTLTANNLFLTGYATTTRSSRSRPPAAAPNRSKSSGAHGIRSLPGRQREHTDPQRRYRRRLDVELIQEVRDGRGRGSSDELREKVGELSDRL